MTAARQNLLAKAAQTKKRMRKGASITSDPETTPAKDRIRQIVGEQGHRVIFPGWPERVEIRYVEDGRVTKHRSLGRLTEVAQMSEKAIASLVKAKLAKEKPCKGD